MYHFVYKLQCPISEKFYIGIHSTTDLNDGYEGSGNWPRNYVKKYRAGKLIKEILEFFPTRKQAENRERSICQMTSNNILCKNIAPGGRGFTSETSRILNAMKSPECLREVGRKMSERLKGKTKMTDPGVAKMAQTLTGRTKENHPGPAAHSVKMMGRTKENHPGVKKHADKIRGRTKETCPGVASGSFKRIKIKDINIILKIKSLSSEGLKYGQIKERMGLDISVSTIANIIKQEVK